MEHGLIQIYTGNGKGKTTAALGQTLRACGQGLHIFIAQFAKGQSYGELSSLKRFEELVTLKQYGRGSFIHQKPEAIDFELARRGWQEAREAAADRNYDIVVLDEIGIALHYKLIEPAEVLDFLKHKPSGVELILTGRNIPSEFFDLADLVTEMREIKHPYQKGIKARKGIEF